MVHVHNLRGIIGYVALNTQTILKKDTVLTETSYFD